MRIDADGAITPLDGSPIPNFEVPTEDELTLAGKVIGALSKGMLCLADRFFPGYELWGAAAATGTVNVTAAQGCAWTAVSNSPTWITVTSGAAGSGSGP